MKQKRDISDLFREHRNIEIQPSPKAWRKLDRKLDNHRRRGRRNVHRLMAMAAAFLLLVVFVLALTMVVGDLDNKQMAYNESTPVQVEDLDITDSDLEAFRVVSFTHHLADRMAAPISEGQPDRRLVPAGASEAENSRSAAARERKVANLADFEWLLGQWRGEAGGQKTLENWRRLNGQNLRGEGIVVSRRDTVFRETILLEDNGEELVLWVQLADRGRSYPFALKEFNEQRAVFVNADMTFPREIHFTRQGDDQCSITYLNTELSDLTEAQSEFLRQRNEVSSQRVKRTLRR